MARIRTVKPELWTDPEFVECSPNARLLFVAALNFASDYGVLPDQPKRLKMQCFPGDAFDINDLIDELVTAGFWQRRTAPDGAKVLVIRTFTRHQKVDKPSLGRWGNPAEWPPEFDDPSPNPPGALPDPSPPEGNGREGIMEGKGRKSSSRSANDHALVIHNGQDDDDFSRTVTLIVDAKVAAHKPNKPRAYAMTVRSNTITEDGDLIRRMLTDDPPSTPEQAAAFVLGYGFVAERERTQIPWCDATCLMCNGDAWIDTGDGLAPCPNRGAA